MLFFTNKKADPHVGDTFYDVDHNRLFMWDGASWTQVTGEHLPLHAQYVINEQCLD